MLIDRTYFIGEINIAAVEQPAITERLDIFIKKYEKKFLIAVLGQVVYDLFTAGLLIDPIPQQWIDLRAKLVNTADKVSPIANYVYWFYMLDNLTETVGAGEAQATMENAIIVDNYPKRVKAWNDMREMVIELRPWLMEYYTLYQYPSFPYHTGGYCHHWPGDGYGWDRYSCPFPVQNSFNL